MYMISQLDGKTADQNPNISINQSRVLCMTSYYLLLYLSNNQSKKIRWKQLRESVMNSGYLKVESLTRDIIHLTYKYVFSIYIFGLVMFLTHKCWTTCTPLPNNKDFQQTRSSFTKIKLHCHSFLYSDFYPRVAHMLLFHIIFQKHCAYDG